MVDEKKRENRKERAGEERPPPSLRDSSPPPKCGRGRKMKTLLRIRMRVVAPRESVRNRCLWGCRWGRVVLEGVRCSGGR